MSKENCVLIGFMGCGKTTVGKRLSYRLKMPMLDTDRIIEQKQEKSIAAIFDEQGESAFREMETECLRQLLMEKSSYVISVGGGLPLREENRALLEVLGTVIYLRATPETIYERLKNDTTRPLLRGDNPFEKITELMKKRNPIYTMASNEILDVDGKSFEVILNEIERIMKK